MNPSILSASLMSGEGVVNGFTEALKKTFIGGYYTLLPGIPDFNEKLVQMVLDKKPSIVFIQIQAPNVLKEETAIEIAKHSCVIQWSGDVRIESPPKHYLDIGKHIHLTLFSNMKDVRGCREQGINSDWLECGVDPDIFKEYSQIKSGPEIVFFANNYGDGYFPLSTERMFVANVLKEEFGDNFGIFGSGWGNASGNFNGDQVAEAMQLSQAKIALSISHFEIEKYASDRLARALASKCMVLTHEFPGLDEMYEVGKELVSFKTTEDLISKCRYYLQNENERLEIAEAGQKRVLKDYTFLRMAENIKLFYEWNLIK